MYFYDAISPIVLAESVDRTKVFRASRWGRSLRGGTPRPDAAVGNRAPEAASAAGGASDVRRGRRQSDPAPPACGADDGEGDYLNCPLTRAEYEVFHDALVHAEPATVHALDGERFFEGCLPIEVMAHRGVDTLRFGPMKPVGLVDPRTRREPYAVVQLRQDDLAGDHFSLVGFQTQIKWGDQARVLRLIPGLEGAEFARFGMVHRNTYVNGPAVLAETWQVRREPALLFAGQMSGVEGYVESAASGLIAGLNAAALALGQAPSSLPRTTAIGALAYYVSHANPAHYEPTNITFGIMEPLGQPPPLAGASSDVRARPRDARAARKLAISRRALADLEAWIVSRAAAGAMVGGAR
ncbi:MAG: methylenetetrahydrofolate--tRNA-(uracil(54)-C(5))-methyltransferase (FADH(2)-oxidizing) TrmFO [Acidobacteria bacterium]|nr:methylenetetrahydrofolate--tRNA-(uracil(54)-C(5))-methyltransferase (FADH(2)-oxidizing) TrmFO [Acidobacteriota bacterium]